MRCGEMKQEGKEQGLMVDRALIASHRRHFPQSGNGLKALGRHCFLRICGSSVRAILQTQQRLKGNVRGKLRIGGEESIEQSYKLIALLRSDCSFLCINPCSLTPALPLLLARSLFPRHCCLSESSCPHSPFFLSPIPWKVVQYQIRSNGLI